MKERTVRHTYRDEDKKRKLINRLKRIEGQIRGLEKMVEEDSYCNDILIQSSAAKAALNAFNCDLLTDHLNNCVARDLREGNDEIVEEFSATIKKLLK